MVCFSYDIRYCRCPVMLHIYIMIVLSNLAFCNLNFVEGAEVQESSLKRKLAWTKGEHNKSSSRKVFVITGLIPTAVLLLGLFFIPESPRWLAKRGRIKDFEEALRYFVEEILIYLRRQRKSRKYLIGAGLMVCQQFGGINGVCFYTSSIFELAGFSTTIGTIIYACLQIVVTGVGAALIDKLEGSLY
ncbi:MFS transporter superfamily [Sesbania bispinosa]|nr:MFS transporter superfamily [Sesbania bispinosa]